MEFNKQINIWESVSAQPAQANLKEKFSHLEKPQEK